MPAFSSSLLRKPTEGGEGGEEGREGGGEWGGKEMRRNDFICTSIKKLSFSRSNTAVYIHVCISTCGEAITYVVFSPSHRIVALH